MPSCLTEGEISSAPDGRQLHFVRGADARKQSQSAAVEPVRVGHGREGGPVQITPRNDPRRCGASSVLKLEEKEKNPPVG